MAISQVWCSRCELPSVVEREGEGFCAAHDPYLAAHGSMGHYGTDDYATCTDPDHWLKPRVGLDSPAGAGEGVEAFRG